MKNDTRVNTHIFAKALQLEVRGLVTVAGAVGSFARTYEGRGKFLDRL